MKTPNASVKIFELSGSLRILIKNSLREKSGLKYLLLFGFGNLLSDALPDNSCDKSLNASLNLEISLLVDLPLLSAITLLAIWF
jgi:hypothetical protein